MSDIFMRFPEGKSKAVTLSYDDGVEQDKRLIQIMNESGLKGTFNLNSGLFAKEGTVYPKDRVHRRMTKKECFETYVNSGHEIAVHGLTHPFLEQLSGPMLLNEIVEDKKNLEQMFGTIVRGMAYPYGTFSDDVVNAIASAGIVYSRTVISTEKFDIPSDWLRLKATCHHNNPALNDLADKFVSDNTNKKPWLFYLWGHSYEFEGKNNWEVIEKFAKKIGGKSDIWYATNIEIYDYVNAYNQLNFSVDGKIISNPSATDVFLCYNGSIVQVKGGSQVVL